MLPFRTASQYPWTLRPPDINVELAVRRKNQAPENVWRGKYEEVVRQYGDCKVVFTDGSKRDSGVGEAACIEDHVKRVTLPRVASIYTAEMKAKQLSLEIIENSAFTSFIITDSMNSVKGSVGMVDRSMLLQKLRHRFNEVIEGGKRVTVCWIPSHIGIQGNERVDKVAKEAAGRQEEFIPIPFRDWFSTIRRRGFELCQER